MISRPPDPNEIEISLFGPGYGECILIHIGDNCWTIIDSCVNPKTKNPVAIEYLSKLNVDLCNVKLIVATHWHDDHVRGLSDVVCNCPDADFFLSEAISQSEFIDFLSIYSDRCMMCSTSGTNELQNIVDHLTIRGRIPQRAISNRLIWSFKSENEKINCEIHSLSPSDRSILHSNQQIAKLIPQIKNEKRRVPDLRPNHAAVVLWIRINDKNILLGSDLENHRYEDMGWNAIVKSSQKPKGKAIVYKVAHHGSETAHNEDVWETMIEKESYAILSPFKKGNIKLPRFEDIKRLLRYSDRSYITSLNRDKKPKNNHFIDKIMDASVKSRKLVNSEFGQIRLRSKIASNFEDWSVSQFGDAMRLY